MKYDDLVGPKTTPGSIANYANYGLAPAAEVLLDAQSLIYQRLRVREMRIGPLPLPLSLGAITAPLPAGFLDPISVHDSYFIPIKARDPTSLLMRRFVNAQVGDFAFPDFNSPDFSTTAAWQQGVPHEFSIFGELLQFDVAANVPMVYWMIYYGAPPLLGNTAPNTETNFLTNRYPHILRAGVLAAAADFRKDDADYQRCMQRLTGLIQDAKTQDDLTNRGIEIDGDYSHVHSGSGNGASW
jgi:hypothetical protein